MHPCCNTTKSTTKQLVETESAAKTFVNNLKSSIFCGTKGFLTFNLALLSYLEYSLHNNTKLKESAACKMKRNVVPFCEMITIPLFVCFVLPAMVGNISLIECALICAALMVATCFVVRTFDLRERFLENMTNNKNYTEKQIEQEFKNESPPSLFVKVLLFPLTILLKALQSCIRISLAAVELFEAVPSFCVDVVFDRNFVSTQSNVKRSGDLLYDSVRNLVPVTKLDECVADSIGKPEARCCQ